MTDRYGFFRRWTRRTVFRLLQDNPGIAGKRFAARPDSHSFVVPDEGPAVPAADPEALPLPPHPLWKDHADSVEEFLATGRADAERMKEILTSLGAPLARAARVLDFGCGCGRMLRWLRSFADGAEIWGVDIRAEDILWGQQNLSPPFYLANITTTPHLPFEDASFDLVYAGSVFTHISEQPDAWLLELRRILRPGGHAYVTVLDKHSLELLRASGVAPGPAAVAELDRLGERDFGMFVLDRSLKGVQVFYDIDFLRRGWGRFFEIAAVETEAYSWSQTAVVLRKRDA
jgi:SAM-dependent methyltransferase